MNLNQLKSYCKIKQFLLECRCLKIKNKIFSNHYACGCGETGKRARLRGVWATLWVRVPPSAPNTKGKSNKIYPFLFEIYFFVFLFLGIMF